MAIVNIIKEETFGIWRTQTNQISLNVGDLDLIDVSLTNTDIVAAINSLLTFTNSDIRRAIIVGIALN